MKTPSVSGCMAGLTPTSLPAEIEEWLGNELGTFGAEVRSTCLPRLVDLLAKSCHVIEEKDAEALVAAENNNDPKGLTQMYMVVPRKAGGVYKLEMNDQVKDTIVHIIIASTKQIPWVGKTVGDALFEKLRALSIEDYQPAQPVVIKSYLTNVCDQKLKYIEDEPAIPETKLEENVEDLYQSETSLSHSSNSVSLHADDEICEILQVGEEDASDRSSSSSDSSNSGESSCKDDNDLQTRKDSEQIAKYDSADSTEDSVCLYNLWSVPDTWEQSLGGKQDQNTSYENFGSQNQDYCRLFKCYLQSRQKEFCDPLHADGSDPLEGSSVYNENDKSENDSMNKAVGAPICLPPSTYSAFEKDFVASQEQCVALLDSMSWKFDEHVNLGEMIRNSKLGVKEEAALEDLRDGCSAFVPYIARLQSPTPEQPSRSARVFESICQPGDDPLTSRNTHLSLIRPNDVVGCSSEVEKKNKQQDDSNSGYCDGTVFAVPHSAPVRLARNSDGYYRDLDHLVDEDGVPIVYQEYYGIGGADRQKVLQAKGFVCKFRVQPDYNDKACQTDEGELGADDGSYLAAKYHWNVGLGGVGYLAELRACTAPPVQTNTGHQQMMGGLINREAAATDPFIQADDICAPHTAYFTEPPALAEHPLDDVCRQILNARSFGYDPQSLYIRLFSERYTFQSPVVESDGDDFVAHPCDSSGEGMSLYDDTNSHRYNYSTALDEELDDADRNCYRSWVSAESCGNCIANSWGSETGLHGLNLKGLDSGSLRGNGSVASCTRWGEGFGFSRKRGLRPTDEDRPPGRSGSKGSSVLFRLLFPDQRSSSPPSVVAGRRKRKRFRANRKEDPNGA